MRITTSVAVALALVACNRQSGTQGAASDSAVADAALVAVPVDAATVASVDAGQGPIGAAGGIFRGEGAQIIVPEDALLRDVTCCSNLKTDAKEGGHAG